jgi:O-antigen ligase
MDLLLPVVAALAAILILPGWSFYFDVAPKVVVIVAGAALALVFLRRWPSPLPLRLKWFWRIAALQAAAILLATLFSTHRWFSLYGSTWRRSGLFAELAVLILSVTAAVRPVDIRAWLRVTVIASIPVALYATLQYFGIDPILNAAGYQFGEGRFMIVRPPGTLGHAAYLATYLIYAAFGGIALARMETARRWISVAAAASALAFFAIVLSGTRAALLGAVVGVVFMLLRGADPLVRARSPDRASSATRKQAEPGGPRPFKLYVVAAAVIAMIAVFYLSPLGERLRARAFWSNEDRLGGARLDLWRDTLRMSAERPWTGYGPETFSMEFPHHQSIELARAYPDFYHESPHNIFLDALVSKGVLGLLALAALVAFSLAIARGPIGGAFVAMLVSQQFTTFTLPTELYFCLAIVMLVSDSKAQPPSPVRVWPVQAALALPFAIFAMYLATGDFLLASARRALDEHEPDRAADLAAHARSWNASADFYFSRRFAATPASDPVERLRVWRYGFTAATHAPESADDPQNALLNLAAFQANLNDAPAVEQTLRRAIAAAPNWFKPHWLLAQVLQQQGRLPEALKEARAAVDRCDVKHPEVIATLDLLEKR